jgi:hypothetical protein
MLKSASYCITSDHDGEFYFFQLSTISSLWAQKFQFVVFWQHSMDDESFLWIVIVIIIRWRAVDYDLNANSPTSL